jgi:hypothetical protein
MRGVVFVSQSIDIIDIFVVRRVTVGQLVGQTDEASGASASVAGISCACGRRAPRSFFVASLRHTSQGRETAIPIAGCDYPSHPSGQPWSGPGVPAGSA